MIDLDCSRIQRRSSREIRMNRLPRVRGAEAITGIITGIGNVKGSRLKTGSRQENNNGA